MDTNHYNKGNKTLGSVIGIDSTWEMYFSKCNCQLFHPNREIASKWKNHYTGWPWQMTGLLLWKKQLQQLTKATNHSN